MQPTWHDPSTTAEGELLTLVKDLEHHVLAKMNKNKYCMGCKGDGCKQCNFKPNRGDEKKPALKGRGGIESNFDFSKNTDKANPIGGNRMASQRMTREEASGEGGKEGEAYSVDPRVAHMATRQTYEDSEDKDASGNKIRGTGKAAMGTRGKAPQRTISRAPRPGPGAVSDFSTEGDGSSVMAPKPDWMGKADITSQFLASKGVIVKYEQEGDVANGVPTFMDHSGGIEVQARPYQTNGTYPDFNDKAPKVKGIHEVAKMPAYAKTGYDEKGSGLHMQLTDGGNRKDGNWNIAPIEERLTELKKGYGKPGLIEEIAALMENVAKNL